MKSRHQTPPGVHFMSQMAAASSRALLPAAPPASTSQPPPILMPHMPQMMSMMQVMSPCLIPQPNGAPPLIVNMPSYQMYPNMANMAQTGMAGIIGALAANFGPSATVQQPPPQPPLQPVSVPPQIVLPSHPLPQTPIVTAAPTVTSVAASIPSMLNRGSINTINPTAAADVIILDSSASNSPVSRSPRLLSSPPSGVNGESALDMTQPKDLSMNSTSSSREIPYSTEDRTTTSASATEARSPVPGSSRASVRSTPAAASSPIKLKIKSKKSDTWESAVPVVPGSPSVPTSPPPARQRAESGQGSSFGFTQYATDSPYPAASINFSSMLLEDPAAEQPSSPQPSTSRGLAPDEAKSKSPAKVEPVHSMDENSNSNVCTVQTVSDLQDALKSDDDIQIVVPNELLETSEFKSFISSLNSFPVEGPAFASSLFPPGGAASEAKPAGKAGGQSAAGGQQAPPNTPNTTRPPSTTAEMATIKSSPPPSPQPCSSREVCL